MLKKVLRRWDAFDNHVGRWYREAAFSGTMGSPFFQATNFVADNDVLGSDELEDVFFHNR